MSARQHRWARKKRNELLDILGRRCAHCGTCESLELDCIVPRGHRHHGAGFISRTCFYIREFLDGNIQVLCSRCNSRKGARDEAIDLNQLSLAEAMELTDGKGCPF